MNEGAKRDVGCVQVGRVVDGRLGVLGQDGSFDERRQFHELPILFSPTHAAASTPTANSSSMPRPAGEPQAPIQKPPARATPSHARIAISAPLPTDSLEHAPSR